jgi:hypothetical protein
MTEFLNNDWSAYGQVLRLFLIPIGGGIPGGVLLARDLGLLWPTMVVLYFVSDVILACVFEPILELILWLGKDSQGFQKFRVALKEALKKTTAHYGTRLGPLALITIAFGCDPMTGRAVTRMVGHGFILGWLLAIAGDMLYFGLLMVSTLWLDGILGDGTQTTLIILALMFFGPLLYRKLRPMVPKAG